MRSKLAVAGYKVWLVWAVIHVIITITAIGTVVGFLFAGHDVLARAIGELTLIYFVGFSFGLGIFGALGAIVGLKTEPFYPPIHDNNV